MCKHLSTNQYELRTIGDKKRHNESKTPQEQHITHLSQRLGGGEGGILVVFPNRIFISGRTYENSSRVYNSLKASVQAVTLLLESYIMTVIGKA